MNLKTENSTKSRAKELHKHYVLKPTIKQVSELITSTWDRDWRILQIARPNLFSTRSSSRSHKLRSCKCAAPFSHSNSVNFNKFQSNRKLIHINPQSNPHNFGESQKTQNWPTKRSKSATLRTERHKREGNKPRAHSLHRNQNQN